MGAAPIRRTVSRKRLAIEQLQAADFKRVPTVLRSALLSNDGQQQSQDCITQSTFLPDLCPRPSTPPPPCPASCPASPPHPFERFLPNSSSTSTTRDTTSAAPSLHNVLYSVPALRSAIAAVDGFRVLVLTARDVASLAVALCLRSRSGLDSTSLASELWWEVARSAHLSKGVRHTGSAVGKDSSRRNCPLPSHAASQGSSAIAAMGEVLQIVAQDPLRRAAILHRAALEDFVLTEAELQGLTAYPVDRTFWCPEVPAQVTVHERCYPAHLVHHAAYRKWGSCEKLERARRHAQLAAQALCRQRQALLAQRLADVGFASLHSTPLCREYVVTGMVAAEEVVEALVRASQWLQRARDLTDRLRAEGLSKYRQAPVCAEHLQQPEQCSLTQVVAALKVHQQQLAVQRQRLVVAQPAKLCSGGGQGGPGTCGSMKGLLPLLCAAVLPDYCAVQPQLHD
ncbi:hypothetical protein N2152v2_010318 [Parachlorella kessleri]